MATTDQPNKQERGKSNKRRYFRRRRRKGALDAEQSDGGAEAQSVQRTRPKGQNRKRNDNRRRSSRRRNSRGERAPARAAPLEEENHQPPRDVYIYTHVTRPAYKDGIGGDFHTDHSLNLSGVTDTPQAGMDHLLESIGRQLDEWFQPEPLSNWADEGMTDDSGADDDHDENAPYPLNEGEKD